jgi:hypothetical protein
VVCSSLSLAPQVPELRGSSYTRFIAIAQLIGALTCPNSSPRSRRKGRRIRRTKFDLVRPSVEKAEELGRFRVWSSRMVVAKTAGGTSKVKFIPPSAYYSNLSHCKFLQAWGLFVLSVCCKVSSPWMGTLSSALAPRRLRNTQLDDFQFQIASVAIFAHDLSELLWLS